MQRLLEFLEFCYLGLRMKVLRLGFWGLEVSSVWGSEIFGSWGSEMDSGAE